MSENNKDSDNNFFLRVSEDAIANNPFDKLRKNKPKSVASNTSSSHSVWGNQTVESDIPKKSENADLVLVRILNENKRDLENKIDKIQENRSLDSTKLQLIETELNRLSPKLDSINGAIKEVVKQELEIEKSKLWKRLLIILLGAVIAIGSVLWTYIDEIQSFKQYVDSKSQKSKKD